MSHTLELGTMKRLLSLILSFLFSAFITTQADDERSMAELPPATHSAYKGYYHFVDDYRDSTIMIVMNPITVFPAEKFKNKKQEQFYWRTVRDVRKALPYAKLIAATLIETYEYIETLPTKEEREDHLKRMEKAVFDQYKPELKKFTRQQARVLVKLIYRETNQPSYDIIRAFLGNFRAVFWQGFGRIFGVSLKADWKPESDPDDAMIDRISTLIEQNAL